MPRGGPLIRQWNLLKTLQAHRLGIDSGELAARMACSKRQVQRDLKVLAQVGFPVTHEDRDFGKRFWRLAPQFIEREGLALSVTELVSLFLARQMLSPLAGTPFGDGLATAFEKIKAMLPREALLYFGNLDETLLVRNVARPDYSGREKEIRILNQAIGENRAVRVRYHSAGKGREWEAALRPYGLVYFGMNLYCIGYLEPYQEVRTLKVSRIRGVKLSARRFARPEGFSLEAYLDGSFGIFSPGPLRTVQVRFSGWAATSLREHTWHPSQKVTKDGPKGLVAEFRLSDTHEFKRWLLGYGRHATVLKPKPFADEMAEELCAACENYAPPARTAKDKSCRA